MLFIEPLHGNANCHPGPFPLLDLPHPGLSTSLSLQICQAFGSALTVDASTAPHLPLPQVLTVDARNHGESPHSPDMSYEAMSKDLQDLLPQLGLVPCVLIGHSMGGRTAMLLALQRVSRPSPGLPPICCRP